MEELTKKELLDKLVENEFISDKQVKGFEKLTQEELVHLVESSAVILSLEEEKTTSENQIKELSDRISTLETEKSDIEAQRDEAVKRLGGLKVEDAFVKNKVTPGFEFTFRSEKYKFSDTAPKKIRYDNQVFTQEALAENENYLIELIGGNSGLIEKI